MSSKTRKLIWSAPLMAVLAIAGALALFVALSPDEVSADHETLPGPVTGLKAMAKSRTSIELAWKAPDATAGGAPTGYRIDYSGNNQVWKRFVVDTRSTQTSHMITEDVSSATQRHYRVFAINAAGTGPISKDPVTAFVSVRDTYPAMAPDSVMLTVVADGPNKIKLSWTAPMEKGSSVDSYTVEEMVDQDKDAGTARQACASGASVIDPPAVTDATNCLHIAATDQMKMRTAEHMSLLAGSTHYYRVTAISGAGNSVSNVVGATTARLTAPASPTGLVAVPVITDIELYWIEPTRMGGHTLADYEIEYQTRVDANVSWPATWSASRDLGDNRSAGAAADADAFNYEFINVDTGQYRFRVRAMQNNMPDGEGYNLKSTWAYSNVLTSPALAAAATTVPLQPVLIVMALDATSVDGEGLRLTWTPSPGADLDITTIADNGPTPSDYRIDRSENGTDWKVGQTRTVTIGQWEDFEPDASDVRHYRLIPINGNVFGQASYNTETVSAANVSAADLLLNLAAVGISTTQIKLDWNAPSGAASYDIYRANVDTNTGGPVTSNTGMWPSIKMGHTGNTYTDSMELNPGDMRWYRVVAKNTGGTMLVGTGGAEAKGMTLEAGEPGMPVDLVVESAADSSFTAATRRGTLLLWNETVEMGKDPHTAYQIQRKVNDGAWETVMEDTKSLATHYNDQQEPAADETRVYRVLARSGTGTGMPSNMAYFPAMHGTAPSGAMASVSGNSVTVTWMDGQNVGGHGVVLFTSDFSRWPHVDRGTGETHTFNDVSSGSYIAVVVALDAQGALMTNAQGGYIYTLSTVITVP